MPLANQVSTSTAAARRIVTSAWSLLIIIAALAASAAPATAQATACTPPAKLGVSIVLDDSGSMSSNDPQDLRRNGLDLALNLLPDGAVAGSGWFHSSRGEYFAPTELTPTNRGTLMNDVSLATDGGSTDFDEAFGVGLDHFAAMPPTVDRKAFVLLTDGHHNVGGIFRDQELTDLGIPIYIIGLGLSASSRQTVSEVATGGYFEADDESSLQSAFADLSNQLLCRQSIANTSVTLDAGESTEVPFTIEAARQGWRGVVSWARGSFSVEAIRPDGTTMGAGSLKPDERYDDTVDFRRTLTALRPDTGGWRLRVTAAAKNSGKADVELRIFDAGEGTSITATPFAASHIVMFPRQRRGASLAALKGSPIHFYGQVYANLTARVSADFQAAMTGVDDQGAILLTGPGGPWSFRFTDFGWAGPGLPVPRLAYNGPRWDPGLEAVGTGLERRLGLRLMRLAEAGVSQEFPAPAGYASMTGAVGASLEVGGLVTDMATWAASRVIAQAGAAALTGGSSLPLLTAAIHAQTVAQLTQEAATLVFEVKRIYGIVVDNVALAKAMRDNLPRLIEGILPLVQQAAAQIVTRIVDGTRNAIAGSIKRVKDLGTLVRRAWPLATTQSTGFVPASELTVEKLRKKPTRLRLAPISRKGAAFLRRHGNRYAQNSRVRLRTLGVSGRPKKGRRVTVATVLPKSSVKGKVAYITLTNGKGIVFERPIEVTSKAVGAKVVIPQGLGRGRWSLSIGGYGATVGKRLGSAEIAGTTFTVLKSGRIKWS